MSDPIDAKLSRLTPSAGQLNRDALLFEAGRASAAGSRRWKRLATALATSQALTLALLVQRAIPERQRAAEPNRQIVAVRPAEPRLASPQDRHIWSPRVTLDQLDLSDRPEKTTNYLDSGPPLRAFSLRPAALMN